MISNKNLERKESEGLSWEQPDGEDPKASAARKKKHLQTANLGERSSGFGSVLLKPNGIMVRALTLRLLERCIDFFLVWHIFLS